MNQKLMSVLVAIAFAGEIFAQAPGGFNYQAIARDGSNNPITGTVLNIEIGILTDTVLNTWVWKETHNVTTNQIGLFSLVVGQGTRTGGTAPTFSAIDWNSGPLFTRTRIQYQSVWKDMSAAKLWSVPYSMVSDLALSVSGDPVLINGNAVYILNNVGIGTDSPGSAKLAVMGDDAQSPDALFEVKRKDGEVIFAVYNHGVRINVPVDTLTKSKKGGFAIGGFDKTKGLVQDYFVVSPDSIRVYFDDRPIVKGPKGGFAIGGFNPLKGAGQDYLVVQKDSVRVYIDNTPGVKGPKGGFAIGGFDKTKAGETEYFGINPALNAEIITPSTARVLWYPVKEAFLAGRVIISSPDSVGTNSFSSGFESKAIGDWSQALGYKSVAAGNFSTSIGYNSRTTGINSFAFGLNARALNSSSYSMGVNSTALGSGSFALGYDAIASGQDAFAVGSGTRATGLGSFAIGFYGRDSSNVSTGTTVASQMYSVALGMGAQSSGKGAFSIGTQSNSSGYYSVAIGYRALSSGWYSGSYGHESDASGNFSIAMGDRSEAVGAHSIAIGQRNRAADWYTVAIGVSSTATNQQAVAIGGEVKATGIHSVAIGKLAQANGQGSVALGYNTQANEIYSMASGFETVAAGQYSNASGFRTNAIGSYSFSSGYLNTASGAGTVAFGVNTNATGVSGFSAGQGTISSGDYSVAFGLNSEASGSYSFAANDQSLASGSWSVALGQGAMATAWNAVAMGAGSISKGVASVSFGIGTIAKPFAAFVTGQYNDTTCSVSGQNSWVDTDPLFIVGNGSLSTRGNAMTILKNGNVAIGHTAPTQALDVNGNIRVRSLGSGPYYGTVNITSDGTLTSATSDISFKENISTIEDALSKVVGLRGVTYNWKAEPEMGRRIGFIAQEVEKVLPELVFSNDTDGYKGVNYAEMTAVLTEAIKQQQKVIENQGEELRRMQAEIETLKAMVIGK